MLKKSYTNILLSLITTTLLMQGCIGNDNVEDINNTIDNVDDSNVDTINLVSAPPPSQSTYDFKKYTIDNNGKDIYTLRDTDNDGDEDVLAISRFNDEIIIFENNNKSFDASGIMIYDFDYAPEKIYNVDLDGDGESDIFTLTDDHFQLYNELSQTNGFYPLSHNIPSVNIDTTSISFGDIDKDGDLDFVVTANDENTIVWYENNSNLEFTSHILANYYTDNIGLVKDSFITDIDNDGDVDIVIASSGNDSVLIYQNNGNQSFEMKYIFEDSGMEKLDIADIDNDGDLDIVVSSLYNLYWLENQGSLNFIKHRLFWDPSDSFKIVDIDNDGDLDVVDCLSNTSLVILDNENNTFTPNHLEYDYSCYDIEVKDMDNDGDLDIFSHQYWYDNLMIN